MVGTLKIDSWSRLKFSPFKNMSPSKNTPSKMQDKKDFRGVLNNIFSEFCDTLISNFVYINFTFSSKDLDPSFRSQTVIVLKRQSRGKNRDKQTP